jgi:hypothetical protein
MYIILVRGGSVNRCTPENTPAQVDLVTSQVDLVHPYSTIHPCRYLTLPYCFFDCHSIRINCFSNAVSELQIPDQNNRLL